MHIIFFHFLCAFGVQVCMHFLHVCPWVHVCLGMWSPAGSVMKTQSLLLQLVSLASWFWRVPISDLQDWNCNSMPRPQHLCAFWGIELWSSHLCSKCLSSCTISPAYFVTERVKIIVVFEVPLLHATCPFLCVQMQALGMSGIYVINTLLCSGARRLF